MQCYYVYSGGTQWGNLFATVTVNSNHLEQPSLL